MQDRKEEFIDQLDLLISLQEEGEHCYRLLAEGADTELNHLFNYWGSIKKDELIDLQALLLVIEEDPEIKRESSLFDPLSFSELRESCKKLELCEKVSSLIHNEEVTIIAYHSIIEWMNINSNYHPKMNSVFNEHLESLQKIKNSLEKEFLNLNQTNNQLILT